MADSIFSYSNILLFGVELEDIAILDRGSSWKVRCVLNDAPKKLEGLPILNGVELTENDFVLLNVKRRKADEHKAIVDGIYRVKKNDWTKIDAEVGDTISLLNQRESLGQGFERWTYEGNDTFKRSRDRRRGARRRRGENRQFEEQLGPDARFARIYGFSFDGTYYDLPRPTLFLVHGLGFFASEAGGSVPNRARAPRTPELTGVAALDFDFGDDLRVWYYDKSDYTVRMDVDTGMFEDVLLGYELGGPSGMDAAAGMNARGMNARGMNARGMNARGMNARGMNARGMNARGGGNSD
ncbi:MAG: hypothetical protein KF810_04410 [Rhizobiaceae bacterium]|nr:hypothetical protein [Rhizobiaceae bacterium]